ncbi:MAG TPA: DUF5684 domain-containing protein, partial [Saprospiraceae bacterium]|nr:DUF5684 domain-containing protein [Saprospiraceae bacterium]
MIILIFLLVTYLLFCYTLRPLLVKAGFDGSKAWIPGANFAEAFRMVGDNPNRVWWLLFPIYNIFVYVGICVDVVRSFGKYKFSDSALAVIYAPYIFYRINKNGNKYVGPTLKLEKEYVQKLQEANAKGDKLVLARLENNNPYKKGLAREWTEAAVFAI